MQRWQLILLVLCSRLKEAALSEQVSDFEASFGRQQRRHPQQMRSGLQGIGLLLEVVQVGSILEESQLFREAIFDAVAHGLRVDGGILVQKR